MEKITKPAIIISSLGRTGTVFFADFFNRFFEDVACFHEPGRIGFAVFKNFGFIKTIKTFGLSDSVLKKLMGNFGIIDISNQRLSSGMSVSDAASRFIAQRKQFIESNDKKYYLESSYHHYALFDIFPSVFEHHKAVFLIRDPRDWVRSNINYKSVYHRKDLHMWLGKRPNPYMVRDKAYYSLWKSFRQFEKLCWEWNYVNHYAISCIRKNPNARLCLFEDLFVSDNRIGNFCEIINYLSEFNGIKIKNPPDTEHQIRAALEEKVNPSFVGEFPKWPRWQPADARKLHQICGNLMKRLGYGTETAWKKLIS